MNTEQEIQLGDDLRQIVADQPFAPDIDAIERRGRRAYRRSVAIRGAAGLGVLALAAGGLIVGTRSSPASITTSSAKILASKIPASSGAPRAETAAYVTKHAEAALADITNYIVESDEAYSYSPNDPLTMWTDPRTGNDYGVQGTGSAKQTSWGSTYLVANVMHWRTTVADYGSRTWWTSVMQAAGPIQGPAPSGPYGGPGGTPAQIKTWLASGVYQIAGHGEVNGHESIGLKRPWAHGYLEVWVDSDTYQTVRVILADFADNPGPLQNETIVTNESWLPRTPAMVSLINTPQIPAGFTQVPAPN